MRTITFGIIGCGLMGRELASAAARWNHLVGLDFRPRIVAACDTDKPTLDRFATMVDGLTLHSDYRALLADPNIEAVYIAVPHHLHAELYTAALAAGKHLLAEKPFGIDKPACDRIMAAVASHPKLLVRCSSEFPFFPGVQKIIALAASGKMGRILEVRCGLLHSSDLDPLKPINWKRQTQFCGEYGCMGDLGMHAAHVPFRLGYQPRDVRALLTKVVPQRPDRAGDSATMVPCDTWDNALLACSATPSLREGAGGGSHATDSVPRSSPAAGDPGTSFPLLLEMKRIAPGHTNTWFLEIEGTQLSARFSTRNPRTLETLPYTRGQPQARHILDVGYEPAYPAITGPIFEFGFPDAIQQMLAAFCDELTHGRAGMKQPFHCATPEEAAATHTLFTAALASARDDSTVAIA